MRIAEIERHYLARDPDALVYAVASAFVPAEERERKVELVMRQAEILGVPLGDDFPDLVEKIAAAPGRDRERLFASHVRPFVPARKSPAPPQLRAAR